MTRPNDEARVCLEDLGGGGAPIQAASGKTKEGSIVELSATTTTQPVVVWAATRAAGDPPDTAGPR